MRFLADGMLGKLARWMRLLGEDVLYLKGAEDDRLVQIALEERRILLTNDLELYRRAKMRDAEAYLIEGKTEVERLVGVAQRFNIKLEIDTNKSRCSGCNNPIRSVTREEVEGKVPGGVLVRNKVFWVCWGCGKIYWKGGHWLNIDKVLRDAKGILEEDKGHKPLPRS